MASSVPTKKLINGTIIPVIGLGTWKSKPNDVGQAVKDALDIGYRLIDCAYVYKNEKEIGQAIKEKIDEGKIQREDIYIIDKLWSTFHKPELVEVALDQSLANLELEYIDLYLMHWPMALKEGGSDYYPLNKEGKLIFADYDYVDTWKAMEEVCKKGKAKSLGLSNFNRKQIERVIKYSSLLPVVIQVECHPYLPQIRLSEFLDSKGIVLMAYSPLGSKDRPWAKAGDKKLLEDPKIQKIANKCNRTVAQVLLRYQIQQGHIVIPKSVNKSRLQENFHVFDFTLSPDDMKSIGSLNCHLRFCAYEEAAAHPHYPFKKAED